LVEKDGQKERERECVPEGWVLAGFTEYEMIKSPHLDFSSPR
jgi:hypothetical protein